MTSNETLNFIQINERAYKYIRQFSIKSVDDALVELITNSIDAYKKTSLVERKIDIIIKNPNILIVKDYAIGLTSEQLQTCFLQAGNYTASDTSRGFFSRGAKDISAIGDVYFTAIKNDKMSQCLLNTDAYGAILIADIDATTDVRQNIGIDAPHSGLKVELKLLPNFQNINVNSLINNLQKIATLREIFAENRNIITIFNMNDNDEITFSKRLTYSYPQAETILDMEYVIPNYEDYKARFVIKQTSAPIPQPTKENQMEFGFLIKDSTSIYEINSLDPRFRWNPYMNYLYGYIYCEGIHDFLLDYDTNGSSIKNPYPIIDPARITGINRQHPFIIQMLSIPLLRIDYILRQLNISKATSSISIDELNDILSDINNLGENIVQSSDITVKWENNYDQRLAKAIHDDRMKYVSYEKAYDTGDNFDIEEVTIKNYIKNEIIKINPEYNSDHIYVQNQAGDLVQIPNMSYSDIEQEPVRIMQMVQTDIINALKEKPYIYRISKSGNLEKLYIFEKGNINHNDENINFKIKNKTFKITFINDLNLMERYIVDTSEGINIGINLNNVIVKKYLSPEMLASVDVDITSLKSTKALFFMKELLTDIFSNIIMTSDVLNKKVMLDSDDYNNIRKAIDYKNKITSQIEIKIDDIFTKYISEAQQSNMNNIAQIIGNISSAIGNNMTVSEELSNMRVKLISTVETALQK
jgi:hypothetical protein